MANFHDFSSVEVSYLEEQDIISLNFKSHSKSKEFRDAWNKALDIAIANDSKKWLMDQRNQSVFPEDQKWAEQDWYPRSIEALPPDPENPRYVALVQSKNFFVEFTAKKFIEANSTPAIVMNVFRDPESAMAWLKEQGVSEGVMG